MSEKLETYLKDYQERKTKYLNNKNPQTIDEIHNKLVTTESLEKLIGNFFLKVAKCNTTKDYIDIMVNKTKENPAFKDMLAHEADLLSYRFKEQSSQLLNLINGVDSDYFNNTNEESLEAFKTSLSTNLSSTFKQLNNDVHFDIFESFINDENIKDEYIPEEKEYVNFYENPEMALEMEAKGDADKIIANQNTLIKKDHEYIRMLEESKYTLSHIEDGKKDFVSRYGEKIGNSVDHFFNNEYKNFQVQNNIEYYDQNPFETADEILEFDKNNKVPNIKPSEKQTKAFVEALNIYRKAGFKGRLDESLANSRDSIVEHIKHGDKTEFMKEYSDFENKVKQADKIIDTLKSVDDKHMYISNLTSFRSTMYPPKYYLDPEGNTLFNTISIVDDFCKLVNAKPEEFVNNPAEVIRDFYYNKEKECLNGFEKVFTDDPFNFMVNIINKDATIENIEQIPGYSNTKNMDNNVERSIPQVINGLCFNNPENRYEYYTNIHNDTEMTIKAHQYNQEKIMISCTNSDKLINEVMPTIILAGKDFNPYTMINVNGGKINIKEREKAKDFNLSTYMLSLDTETICNRLKDGLEKYEKSPVDNGEKVLEKTGELAKEILLQKTGCEREVVDKLIDHYNNKKPLSKTELNTCMTKMQYAEITKYGINKENVQKSFEAVEELRKKYYSHNIIARAFSPSLRKQSKEIENMKTQLSKDSGVSKNQVNNLLKVMHSHDVDKDEAIENIINDLDFDEPTNEYKYEISKDIMKQEMAKKDYTLSEKEIDRKLVLVEKELKEASKDNDVRDKEFENIKKLADKRLEDIVKQEEIENLKLLENGKLDLSKDIGKELGEKKLVESKEKAKELDLDLEKEQEKVKENE